MAAIDKAKGVLVGLAAADALGALVEFIPLRLQERLPIIRDFTPPLHLENHINTADNEIILNSLQHYIDYMVLPGLYTDDTQQTILLAASLINNKGVNQKDIANLFVKGAQVSGAADFGIFRHAGPGFKETVKNLMSYKPLNVSGAISAGNGAAMRISPIGIFYRNDIEKLLTATIEVSMITHRDIRGIAAAGLVSYTIAYLFDKSPDNFDINHFIYNLKLFVKELESVIVANYSSIQYDLLIKHQVSDSIDVIADINNVDYEIAIKKLDKLARETSRSNNCGHNSPFALGSVLFSLYLFINQGLDWEKAVITAVNSGGDTDTIAAILSSMCGALHNYNNIPSNWTKSIFNLDVLERLGQSLITLEPITADLIEIEKNLCKMENDYRSSYRQLLKSSIGYS